ncbi:hypothetical protein ACWIGB_05340 [Streptomyces albidoflavus]
MSISRHVSFLSSGLSVDSTSDWPAVLTIHPDGSPRTTIAFHLDGTPSDIAKQAAAVERLAEAVTAWAEGLRARANAEQDAAAKLAAAQAEIERLRGEQGGAA